MDVHKFSSKKNRYLKPDHSNVQKLFLKGAMSNNREYFFKKAKNDFPSDDLIG